MNDTQTVTPDKICPNCKEHVWTYGEHFDYAIIRGCVLIKESSWKCKEKKN